MAKKREAITLGEFRRAFDAALPVSAGIDFRDALKGKLEGVFHSKKTSARLTRETFNARALTAIEAAAHDKLRTDIGGRAVNLIDHMLLGWIVNKFPVPAALAGPVR